TRSVLSFFFQAEDGIRDFHVTGVQTCALPISNGGPDCPHTKHPQTTGSTSSPGSAWAWRVRSARAKVAVGIASVRPRGPCACARSEERRVGKEGRSRWSGSRERQRGDGRPRGG